MIEHIKFNKYSSTGTIAKIESQDNCSTCISKKERLQQKRTRGKGEFNCGCGKRYKHYKSLFRHLKNFNLHKKLSGTTKVGEKGDKFYFGKAKDFQCDKCHKSYKNRSSLYRHISEKHCGYIIKRSNIKK
jgi:hypothetical protein